MAKKLGIIKSISGSAEVIAVDKSGNQRVLKVGDSLYEGETVKTTSADSKVVIATNNGKELSMIGEDTLSLDPKATAADSQVAALQKALLNGANLEDLEETAAGGNSGGRGDGMSLGETRFEHGGHYSNISASTSAINPLGAASFAGPVEGKSGGLDSGRGGSDDDTAGAGTTIDPETTRKPSNPEIKFPEDTNKDGKISDDENKAGDKDAGKTTVEVTIPKDGSVKPGDKVVVTDDNGKKTEKPINQDDIDKGKIDIPVDLNPGKDNNVTAEIINPNNPNNPGKDSKVIGEDSENTKVPEAPVINEIIDDVKGYGEDNKVGNVLDVKGHLTNDKTPTIKGTAKAGSKVEIYDNGDKIGETTAKADGSWEFTPELTKQGEHKFTATAENKFGKSTPSNEATIDLDSIAPKLDNVKITPIDTNSKADDIAELTMGTGHTDTPNAEILFRDENNNIIGKGHANSAGDFLIQLDKAVQPGTPVVVQAIDKAGNAGTDMAIAGNIEHPNDHTAPKVDIDTVTPVDETNPSDGTPDKGIVKGKSDEPNAPVVVTDENGKTIGTGTTDDKGNFEITTTPIKPGDKVKVEVTDKAGHKGSDTETAGDTEILHKDLPEAPVINEIIDDVKGYGEDTKVGNVLDVKGHLTNDKTPTIKGTAKAGSKVEIYDNGDKIGETTAKADGSWEFTPELTKQGEHKFTATAENKFGKSTPSNEATIDLDSIAPKLDNVKITPIDTNSKADDIAELTMGTGHTDTPNAEILFRDENNNIIGKGHANSSGDFLIQLDKAVQPGTPVVVQAIDKAGNAGTDMAIAGNIEHPNDTKGPKVDIDTVTPVDETNPSDGTPDKGIVKGESDEPNAPVVVTDKNGKTIGTGTTDDKGNFEITTDPIKPGDKVKVEVTDKAGHKGSDTETAGDTEFVDNTPPSVEVKEVTPVDTNNPADGNPDKGIVKGHSDEPNAPVVVKDKDGKIIGTGTTDDKGNFEITTDPIKPGDKVNVEVTDKAGNKGNGEGTAGNIEHPNDHTAPSEPTITFVEDLKPKDGKLNKDENSKDSDNANTTAKISIPTDAVVGDVIKYTVNGGAEESHTITNADKAAGHVEIKVPVTDGQTSSVTAKIVDQAGNASKEVSGSVDVDLTIGNPKVRFLEDTDNNGVLSVAEVAAIKDGKAHWVIDIPTDGSIKAGDVIQSIDSKGNWVKFVEITDEMIKDGRFEATFNVGINKLKDGKYETPEYRFADDAGNVSDSSKATLTLDSEFSRKPSNPEIKFPEDTNKDGKISDDENKAGDKDTGKTTVEVTIPKDGSVKPGDKVVVTDDNGKKTEKPINQDDIDKGKIDIPVDLNPGKDNNVTAEIINPNNPNNPGKDSKVIGEASSTVKVTIDEIIDDVTGGVVNGDVKNGLTNDNLPTFKGSAAPGATVEIYESFYTTTEKTLVGKTVADANGKWSFTPTEAMGDGEHYFEAVATDKVGNKSTSDRVSLDVDTFADAPVIDAVNDNVDSQTGNVLDVKTKVALTNDSTPTLEGYAEPDSVITIYEISELNGEKTAIGTVTADNHGGWKFELPELGDGEYKYTTRAQDKAGNISDFSEEVVVNADLIAPSEPTITFVEDVNPKDGKLNKAENGKDGDSTSTKAQISVPGDAEENDVIHYTVNGEEKTHTITYNDRVTGYVEIKVPVVDGKASSVTAKIVDQAGNASKEVSSSIDSDFTAPNVKITGIIDNVEGGVYKGNVAGTNTNDNKPTIKGTADANQEVVLYDNNKEFGRATADKDGNWEFKPSDYKEPLADLVGRVHVIKAVVTDAAGNTSEATSALEVDTTIGAPKVSIKEDADNNGVLSVDEAKNLKDSKIHWEVEIPKDGTVSAGDVLQVLGKDGKWKIEKVLSNDDLGKSFEYEATLSGKHFESPSYRIVDLVGNQSTAIHANVQLDSEFSRKPSNPEIKFPEDTNKDGKISDDENKAGDKDAGKTTVEVTIPKDGSVKPGDKVVVTDDNGKKTEKPINQDDIDKGKIDIPVDLNPGKDNNVTAEIINPNNPNNPGKDSKVIGEDSENTKVPEAPVINEIIDDVKGYGEDNKVGNVLDVKGHLTNDKTPTIKGTAKAGSKVEIYDNGDKIGETTAKADGSWEFTPELTKQGEHKFTATAENKFGKSTPSNEATIDLDSIAPKLDNVKITPIDTNSKADDIAELTMGTGHTDTPNAEILFRDENNNIIGKGHANSAGDFLIQLDKAVQPGTPVVVQAIDKAGNAGTDMAIAGNIEHPNDHTAPKVDIDTVTPVDETNPSDGTPDKGIVKGKSDEPNAPVVVTDENGKTIGTGTTDDKGNFEITTTPIKPGDKVKVEVTDKAGHKGSDTETAGDTEILHKDLPEAPVINEIIDDVKGYGEDTKVGNVLDVKGHLTNDKTPTIKGTAKAGSKVEIYDNGDKIGETTAKADGSWEFTPELTKQGEHKFTATAENKFGKSTPSNEATIDLDSIAPKLDNVKITPIDTNSKADDIAELTMGTGHTDTPNAEILFRDENNNIIGKGHANSSGDFLIQLDKAVQPGTPVVVQAIDKAGNAGTDMAIAGNIEHPNDTKGPKVDIDTVTPVDETNPSDGTPDKGIVKGESDEPNAPVVVTDKNGKTIGTGTTDDKGNFEITTDPIKPGDKVKVEVTDKAGHKGSDTETAGDTEFVDNTPPSVEVKEVTPVDTNNPADGNPDKGIVKGHSDEPNAPVVVKDKDGKIIGTGTTDDKGNFEITTDPIKPGDKVNVEVTDKAGNKGNGEGTAGNIEHPNDHTAPSEPTITFVEDLKPKDGKLNKDENSKDSDNANTTAKISIPTDAVVGDVIKYTVNGGAEESHTITNADKAAGHVEIKVPVTDGQTSSVTAKIVDQAGNASKEVSGSVDVDLTIGNPKVRFLEDTDNNGVLSVAEVAAIKDGKAHWVIDIPTDGSIKAGDVIQSIDSKGNWVKFVEITDEMIKDGRFEATFNVGINKLKDGKYETPEYRFADDAGNVSDSSKATLTLDSEFSRKPSNPEIKFPEDTNKDGKISDDENKAGDKDTGKTTVEVTIPKDGSVKPGDKVVVTDDNGKKTEKPINQDDIDKGKIDIPVDLNPGKDNNVTAEIINPNNPNNPGKDSKVIGEASSTVKVTIDEIIDDVTGGVVNGDVKNGLTNDNLPTFKGSAAPGATVEIYESFYTTTEKTLVGKTVADANGKWSFTPTEAMGDGEHYFEAVATDKVGNKSTSDRVSLDVDTFADAPVIDAVNDNVDSQTGNVLDVKTKVALTNDSTPTLEGYAEPDSVITIYEISELNGEKTAIGTVTADNHGGWKFELPELGDGEYKYTTRAQDKAGNISDFSEEVVVNADLIAPSEPTITFVEDVNPKDGKLNKAENGKDGDSTSTKAQISVPGDAEENDVIHYTVNGEEKTHTITYNDRVTGYVEIKVPVVDGKASSVTAKIVDQAGNASKEVSSSIDSDFTAPNVKITGIIDNVEGGVYKGNVAGTNTNDNKPTIKGTADANQEVVLYDNNKEFGRATADKDGNWEFKPSDYKEPLADLVGRVHVIKAVVTDAAGNTSEATSALEVDTTIGAPKVSIKEDADNNGVLSVDEAKNLKDSKIHWEVEIPKDGTVSAGDVLQVLGKDGKWKIEKVLSNDDLGKSFEYEATLSGKHFESPSYRIVDLVGNQSTAIHANVQLDSEFSRKPSNPEIKFPEDTNKDGKISDDENKAGDKDAGKTTVEVTIPKDGSVKPGDKVVVTDDNGKKTEKPINQDDIDKGKIDIPVDLNPGKDNNVTAEIINPNNPNNPGKDSKVIGEDSENTKVPEAPVITEVIDDQRGGKFNEDVKGGLTNDSTPTFKGTAKPGTTITLKNGNDLIADNIPVKTDGSWEFTIKTPLAQGDYSITATATNAAGKVSAPSDAATIKIDLHSDEPVITEIIDNVAGGVVNGDVKGGLTNDNTPTLKGTAEPFATVEIKIDGRGSYRFENGEVISNWTAVADKDGNWEFTTPKLSDGHHNFEAQATDVAGNNSQPSALVSIDVDTHIDAPVITAVTDNWWGGVENGGNILGVNDGFTNDTTPTFKGTAEAGSTIVLKNGNDIINKDIIVKADADGNWEFTPKSPLAEGEYNVVAIATDKAGNVSNPSNVATVNVDTSTTQPVITEIIDDVAGGVVGNVKNALTNDNLPTLKGTAEAFSTVKIMVDDRLVFKDGKEVTVTADKDGNWEYTFEANLNWGGEVHAALEDGVHTLKVQTTDRAGNRSAVSEWSSVDVDTTIGAPTVKITTDINSDKKIDIADASALKDGKLKWIIDIPENTVKVGDRVQILGKDAQTWTDIFKVTAQDIAKGFIERDEFSIDMPKSRGFQTPSYRLVDDAGNVSEGSMDAVKIVGFAPKAPTIIAVLDNEYGIDPKNPTDINAGDTTGNVLEGTIAITNDKTPTLMGKAEAGTTIILKNGDTVIADNIKVDANGNWHYEPEENSPWADGDYKITAIAKNVFGKESESSSPITVTVDTTAPEVTLTSIEDSVKTNDVVDFTGNVKDKFTNDNTPLLKGTAEAGSVIIIKYGEHHENVVTTKADKNGHWEYKITNPLSDGEHIISYQAVDKAGNTSLEYVANVTVDTKIADAKVEFIEDTNNDGKFSWKENIENPNIGRMAWKAIIPQDGSIKEGDIFHYRWGSQDSWHSREIKQSDIERGFIGEKVQNQYEQGQPNAGKPLAFGANANGRVYEAEAYFSDAAGNQGKVGSDKVVFDFSDKPADPVKNIKINAEAIYGDNNTGLLLEGHGPVLKASTELQPQLNGNDNYEIDVKTITHKAEFTLGSGDDVVNIHKSGNGWGWINMDSKIDLGDGNNRLIVAADLDHSTVISGKGDDYIEIKDDVANGAKIITGAGNDTVIVGDTVANTIFTKVGISTGDGNDSVTIKGDAIDKAKIDLGNGDDTLTIKAAHVISGVDDKGALDGGKGYDKLIISSPEDTIDLKHVSYHAKNFEELDISGAKNTTLKVGIKDVLDMTDDKHTLKITGDKGDTVDLKEDVKGSGWHQGASEDGYTTYTNNTVTIQIKDEIHVI